MMGIPYYPQDAISAAKAAIGLAGRRRRRPETNGSYLNLWIIRDRPETTNELSQARGADVAWVAVLHTAAAALPHASRWHARLSPGLDNSTELDRKLDSYSTGYSTG